MQIKKTMKIHLVSRFFNPINGGGGRISADFLKFLKEKTEYIVSTSQAWGKSNFSYVLYTFGTLSFTLPRNVDLYHALTSMEAFFLPPKKTVVTVHDLIPLKYDVEINTHYGTNTINKMISYAFFNIALKKAVKCAKIVCVSEETKKELLNVVKCKKKKVSVIPWGIQEKYRYVPMKRKNDKLVVGTLSYLDGRKRVHCLIEEFKKIKDKDLELRIGGHGILLQELIQMAKSDKRIKFYGYLPEKKMLDFYKELDVFVFPSKAEGFGLPIIEAARVGRPVITLKDSLIPKLVKENTIQIMLNDLCEILPTLKDYKVRKQIGYDLSLWSEEFRQENAIKQYLETYSKTLGHYRRTTRRPPHF